MKFSAQQIAMLLGGKITGDANRQVWDVGAIESAKEGQLTFLCDAKYLPHLPKTGASVVLMTDSIAFDGETNATIIRVENARAAMGQLLALVAKAMNPAKQGVEQPCFISEGVEIPEDAYIGAFAYIGKNVQLGKGVQIYPHTYVGDNVRIGDNTILYSGVKIYYNCVVGQDCILHAGVVVGSDGFGFEPDAKGVNQKLPQIGNVIIEDDVFPCLQITALYIHIYIYRQAGIAVVLAVTVDSCILYVVDPGVILTFRNIRELLLIIKSSIQIQYVAHNSPPYLYSIFILLLISIIAALSCGQNPIHHPLRKSFG